MYNGIYFYTLKGNSSIDREGTLFDAARVSIKYGSQWERIFDTVNGTDKEEHHYVPGDIVPIGGRSVVILQHQWGLGIA